MPEVGAQSFFTSSRKGRAKGKKISGELQHKLCRNRFPDPIKIDRQASGVKLELRNKCLWLGKGQRDSSQDKQEGQEQEQNNKTDQPDVNRVRRVQHYCYVKRVNALLFDQKKNSNAKRYCMMCLTGL